KAYVRDCDGKSKDVAQTDFFFSFEPFPKPTSDFLENLKDKPFNLSTLYFIVSLQAPNESSGKLFGLYKSQDYVLEIN
ncbi:14556_t:CDS:2, partial [Gigaspora margarita]